MQQNKIRPFQDLKDTLFSEAKGLLTSLILSLNIFWIAIKSFFSQSRYPWQPITRSAINIAAW